MSTANLRIFEARFLRKARLNDDLVPSGVRSQSDARFGILVPMLDCSQHRARALEIWAKLMEKPDRKPRQVIALIDGIADSIQILKRAGEERAVIEYLEADRTEAIGALIDTLIERSEDRIGRAKSAKTKIAKIEEAITEFKKLGEEFGESKRTSLELSHLHGEWIEACFFEMMDQVEPLLRRGQLAEAFAVCERARAFAQNQTYQHESDRQLHLDEVIANVARIKALEHDPKKLKRLVNRKPKARNDSVGATENQKVYAAVLGIKYDDEISGAALSELISESIQRRNQRSP